MAAMSESQLSPEQLRRALDLHERIMKLHRELMEMLGAHVTRTAPGRGKTRRNYLTPPPLSPRVRAKLYTTPDAEWDKIEAEAVSRGRRALNGRRLEDL